jgi:hypothetical protein
MTFDMYGDEVLTRDVPEHGVRPPADRRDPAGPWRAARSDSRAARARPRWRRKLSAFSEFACGLPSAEDR